MSHIYVIHTYIYKYIHTYIHTYGIYINRRASYIHMLICFLGVGGAYHGPSVGGTGATLRGAREDEIECGSVCGRSGCFICDS